MSSFLAETSLIPLPADPSMRFLIGVCAGLGSTLCWTFTSISFTISARRFGSTAVNMTRSVIAMVVILLAVKLVTGSWLAEDDSRTMLWLALSGIAGLAIGDQLIFGAFVRMGPRLTLLVLNIAPVATALLAWPVLGEPLGVLAWAGMMITLLGVAWVVAERRDPGNDPRKLAIGLGVSLALGGMMAIAIGNVLAKLGMLGGSTSAEPIPPLVAHNLRMIAGTIALTVMATTAGLVGRRIGAPPETDPAARPSRPLALVTLGIGTVLGPILGLWLFLLSAALLKVAIAATVLALTPIVILPFNSLVEKTPVSPRAILGAVVAVAGVAILTFSEPASTNQEDVSGASGITHPEAVDFPP